MSVFVLDGLSSCHDSSFSFTRESQGPGFLLASWATSLPFSSSLIRCACVRFSFSTCWTNSAASRTADSPEPCRSSTARYVSSINGHSSLYGISSVLATVARDAVFQPPNVLLYVSSDEQHSPTRSVIFTCIRNAVCATRPATGIVVFLMVTVSFPHGYSIRLRNRDCLLISDE
ncbi:hypothetical protein OGAPHI_003303 [Ogataea philodendri]|uniref:Uncharacterized protein n=1 Tax=Ogataea philodendri TaxID=1378263 RepID=A0A9P8P8Y4_9ASCO|nr:uncharacterized protein OGAPHI_003303 [Ogataea philodendri]KAH3666854.1 hypothetical protein OGAPHI_003303 [Ogataea philodendri]